MSLLMKYRYTIKLTWFIQIFYSQKSIEFDLASRALDDKSEQ